jgi:hypothetical protein
MIQTRATLDRQGCVEGCTHDHSVLFLHASCHLKAGLTVSYVKATGVLEMRCARCSMPVAAIQVARTLEVPN